MLPLCVFSLHYFSYGKGMEYMVDKPIKDCNYAFCDAKYDKVYRVKCIDEVGRDGVVSVYLIDEMRNQNVPVNQLRKVWNSFFLFSKFRIEDNVWIL